MSLSALPGSSASPPNRFFSFKLKTADQYDVWRGRIADACWATTGMDLFAIDDDDCDTAILGFAGGDAEEKKLYDWVNKLWMLVTGSLHDDLYKRVSHVRRGMLPDLLKEISHALVVSNLEEVPVLRLELYSGTMQSAGNDLQNWINYIVERASKLSFLGHPVPDAELVAIFLKGLHSTFQQLQVYFSVPGNMPTSLETAMSIVRKFAATPVVAAELAKLQATGLSQTVFSLTHQPQTHAQPTTQMCKLFARNGHCRFGAKCKFVHAPTPALAASKPAAQGQRNRQCDFCKRFGHTEETCQFKERLLRQLRTQPSHTAALASVAPPSATPLPTPAPTDVAQFVTSLQLEPSVDEKLQFHFVLSIAPPQARNKRWVMDSGATCCATYLESDCVDVRDCVVTVTAAGESFTVLRTGTAVIETTDEQGRAVELRMRDTLISPKFPYKLLALQAFTAKGYSVVIGAKEVRIEQPNNKSVFIGTQDLNTKLFFLRPPPSPLLLARSYTDDTDVLWRLHLRHGHRNFADVARQYNLKLPKTIPACTSCIMGKAHLHPHLSSGFKRATRIAEGFHSDFRGPFSVPTSRGEVFLLTIIDDFSRRIFGFLAKSQSEWYEIWTQFVVRIEAEIGKQNCIAWLLSDNGAVYKSKDMQSFCAKKGIQQRFSAPHAQWMDHTAERNMRTIGEMATTTMIHANFPKSTWGFATLHAINVINRTTDNPQLAKQAGTSPAFSRLEKWMGRSLPGQTKGLYPFGCLAFKHVPAALRTKLDAHATPSVYLGLDPNCRAYLLGSLFRLDLSTSVEVTFVENVFPFRKIKNREAPSSLLWGADNNLLEGDPRLGMFDVTPDATNLNKLLDSATLKAVTSSDDLPLPRRSARLAHPVVEEKEVSASASSSDDLPLPRRSARLAHPDSSTLLFDATHETNDTTTILLALTETQLLDITPKCAEQAITSKSAEQWLAAMNREKQCHVKNGTFGASWAGDPKEIKPIPAGWVFKVKHRGDPIEEKDLQPKQFKARVVIRGQYMKEGLDFNETFAPVAKPMTIRAVLALATKYDLHLKAGDIETAFLTAQMDCEVWVRMPPFWGKGDEDITGIKCDTPPRRLLKGVPGIPQGSRLFYDTFAEYVKSIGWFPAAADKCLFLNNEIGERCALVLWVDDFIFMHETESTWKDFISNLCKRFTVPTVGNLQSFLGMNIVYANRRMQITQAHAIQSLLERAGMQDCNPVPTPCRSGAVWTKKDCADPPETPAQCTHYRSLIALANFVANWTRPDITYVVNKLCKFMSNPGANHWQALKHLLRYLKGTASYGLRFDFSQSLPVPNLHGYTDASFADCPDTSRSTIGYVFFYGGAILSWFSKLHSLVTTATNHSEYMAFAQGAKEAQWFVYLFEELEPSVKHTPVPLFVDNSGVISLTQNPVDHAANKHIRVNCHFVRELAHLQVIAPQRVTSEDNLADLLTKGLNTPRYEKLRAHFSA